MTWQHGTRYAWFVKGCHCDECREGRRDDDRARRQRRRERAKKDTASVPHGSPWGHIEYGCNCEQCVAAARSYRGTQQGHPSDAERQRCVEVYATEGIAAAVGLGVATADTIRRWAKDRGVTGYRKPAAHGRPWLYRNGCRCEECREGHRARMLRLRRQRFAQVKRQGLPAHVRHGASAYANWGCRCEVCTAANTAASRPYVRAYYERKKAESA